MNRYAYNPDQKKSARVFGRGTRVSQKSSEIVCSRITGMGLDKGKTFLLNMLMKKESISGKHYTNTANELLNLIKSAESNAEFKGLEPARLVIHASAHKGFSFYRPRNWKRRLERRKVTNLQVVLEER